MNKNLGDYVKIYKNVISNDMCENIVCELQTAEWAQHNFYNANTKSYYSNKFEPDFSFKQITENTLLMEIIWKQIRTYVLEDCNSSYFNSWQGFNQIKYNKYTSDQTMKEHCDHIHDMFDGIRKGIPILSIVGLLNTDFAGGDFILLDEKINITQGDVVIFPSCFLFPHKVNAVTTGTRYSFASWVY